MDVALPETVVTGRDAFLVIGAVAGGSSPDDVAEALARII